MRKNVVLWFVAVPVAVAILPALPYGYYSVMRWVVCALCAWLAVDAYRTGHESWAWCWGVLAGIYNPVLPVHANRAVWTVVNIVTIIVVATYASRKSAVEKGVAGGG